MAKGNESPAVENNVLYWSNSKKYKIFQKKKIQNFRARVLLFIRGLIFSWLDNFIKENADIIIIY